MKLRIFIFHLILLMGAACLRPSVKEDTVKEVNEFQTSAVESTNVPLKTEVPPADTLAPTLNPAQMSIRVAQLLQSNNGCNLPCWWGVIPGKTTWNEAKDVLTPIAKSFYGNEGSNPVNYEVYLPAPYPQHGEFRQEYLVEDGMVQIIEILPQAYSKYSVPQGIILEYGNPEVVYLGTIIDQLQSSQIIMYYPSQGILALYVSPLQSIQKTDFIQACFSEIDHVDLFLRDPKDSFEESLESIFMSYENTFLPLEVATGLSIREFENIFTDPNQPDCLKTPRSLWPDYTPTN